MKKLTAVEAVVRPSLSVARARTECQPPRILVAGNSKVAPLVVPSTTPSNSRVRLVIMPSESLAVAPSGGKVSVV